MGHFRINRALIGVVALAVSQTAAAQTTVSDNTSFRSEIFAGSVPENYLRYLQTIGMVPLYPWSSRAFSPRELDFLAPKDSAHPWSGRFASEPTSILGIRYDILSPDVALRYNTGAPYGSNDGPIWAGRGLTSSAQLGIALRYGPASLTIAPLAFRSENSRFYLPPNGRTGPLAFANPLFGGVDRPERFGPTAYSQLDPGQSTFSLDFPFVSVGASTANMVWGPATEYPLILGNNAAGFPHLYAGTSEPLNLWLVTLHARVMWGRLAQSKYSPVSGSSLFTSKLESGRRRFTTGAVASAQIRGVPGLELGAARFYHSVWPASGIPRSYWTKVFQGVFKDQLKAEPPLAPGLGAGERGVADNQLAEVFFRWALPHSGFELSGEYGREDHSENRRDFVQEIDHSRMYNFGLRKVITHSDNSLTAARLEVINFQTPQIGNSRGEGEIYVHGVMRQGHTEKGQLLGADVGVGAAAGSTVAVDHYTKNGKWTAKWQRDLKAELNHYDTTGVRSKRGMDVSHAVGFEMTRFMRGVDLTGGLTFVREFNRYFLNDASNLNAIVEVRYNLR
jgi:hypothetical protein